MSNHVDTADRPMTRTQKRAETRNKLLESAAHVFAENGYERASVDDIAEQAGYSKGAVYSNFESKEELFLAVYDMAFEEALRESGEVTGDDPVESMTQELVQVFRGAMMREDKWPLLMMEFWTYAARHPNLRHKVAERSARRREALAEMWRRFAAEQGFELPADAQEIGSLHLALADGAALQRILYPERVDLEYVEGMARLLTSALSELGIARGRQ